MNKNLNDALQTLGKWRKVFVWWQLGKDCDDRSHTAQAIRDHRETTMMLRAENSALLSVLVQKNVLTIGEYETALEREAKLLSADYAKKFPGIKATLSGLDINVAIATDTMAEWKS